MLGRSGLVNKLIPAWSVTLIFGFCIPTAYSDWKDRLNFSGFGSVTYVRTNEEVSFGSSDPDQGVDEDGSFDGSRVAMNASARISDDIGFLSQFAVRGGKHVEFDVDWAFFNYRINNRFTVRAGKIKFPVGLVNEYVDVGYSYPWLTPPPVIYSESGANAMAGVMGGPQATREAYLGASVLFQRYLWEDWSLTADLFGGEVDLEGMKIEDMLGVTLALNYEDVFKIQVSHYSGTMRPDDRASMMGGMMDGKTHEATLVGVNVDWNNIVFYAEYADVEMDIDIPPPMMMMRMMGNEMAAAQTSYVTLGYRIGDFLPFLTKQRLKKGELSTTDEQQITSAGLQYGFTQNFTLKVEYSRIETDVGEGLFAGVPGSDSVNLYGFAVDFVF